MVVSGMGGKPQVAVLEPVAGQGNSIDGIGRARRLPVGTRNRYSPEYNTKCRASEQGRWLERTRRGLFGRDEIKVERNVTAGFGDVTTGSESSL